MSCLTTENKGLVFDYNRTSNQGEQNGIQLHFDQRYKQGRYQICALSKFIWVFSGKGHHFTREAKVLRNFNHEMVRKSHELLSSLVSKLKKYPFGNLRNVEIPGLGDWESWTEEDDYVHFNIDDLGMRIRGNLLMVYAPITDNVRIDMRRNVKSWKDVQRYIDDLMTTKIYEDAQELADVVEMFRDNWRWKGQTPK